MSAIVPYLTVGNAAEAIAFYKKAFDARENSRMPTEDGKRLMHSDLTIHGGTIFVMDEFPEHGSARRPNGDSPVGIVIQFSAPKDVDAVYAQAVKAGAKGTSEPADMFWGARFAALTDPFGHGWMLNAPLPQKK
ncbi:MAG TPA: glyoxalase/bleomycin resistance/extradiol dioxygenase family protein [Dongiaceae bacterium]